MQLWRKIESATSRAKVSAVNMPDKSNTKNRYSQLNYLINLLIELLSIQLIKVNNKSMEPAIGDGSWVVSVRAGFRRREPRRFDVVRLEEPGLSGHWILKRIVGLPGEEVSLRQGDLYVDDLAIADSFAYCPDAATDNYSWWLRDDEYVVLGDNRQPSIDTRKFGVVSRSSLRGRIYTLRGHIY